jgi:hypothetical protein
LTNQTVSTVAFIGAALAIGLFVFKVIPVKQALLYGGGAVAIGYFTQPALPGA